MRLMLQAFRRGLLKAEHTFGITSAIRERLVLDALGLEDNSDYMWRHVMAYNTVMAPHYDPKRMTNICEDLKHDLAYIAAGYRFKADEQVSPEDRLLNSTKGLLKLYNQMQKNGIIDAFKRKLAESRKQDADENA